VLKDHLDCDAETIMQRLGKRGVATRPFFWPMHEQPVLKRMVFAAGGTYPVAERLARRGFYIPSGLALTSEQIHEVAAAVREELREVQVR
jgi:perosamine synthetase